jgi:hypothetical protein
MQLPIGFSIPSGTKVLHVQMTGDVTAHDFRELFASSAKDPNFSPTMDRLILIGDVKSFPTGDEIAGIATRIRERAGDGSARFAVVTRDPLATGVANMLFRQAGQSTNFAIFPSREDAERWLGLPPG